MEICSKISRMPHEPTNLSGLENLGVSFRLARSVVHYADPTSCRLGVDLAQRFDRARLSSLEIGDTPRRTRKFHRRELHLKMNRRCNSEAPSSLARCCARLPRNMGFGNTRRRSRHQRVRSAALRKPGRGKSARFDRCRMRSHWALPRAGLRNWGWNKSDRPNCWELSAPGDRSSIFRPMHSHAAPMPQEREKRPQTQA
jgi:hypothetical protein